jgi:hypothetical protein
LENNYTFSFIIGYRHNTERFNNLKKVIEWILGFKGVELIIVEQDKSPKLRDFTLKGFKYVFTESNMPYNRSWAFNVGTKHSTTNNLVFGDSDLIMDPNEFITAFKMLENYECVSPYNKVIDLEPIENNWSLDNLKQINRPGRGELDNQKINLTGGMVFFRKDAINKLGGWGEEFMDWGGEDDFQTFKVKNLITWYECEYRCYHLYHHRGAPNPKYYQRNLQMLQKLLQMDKNSLVKYIYSVQKKVGLKNKYQL